MIVNLDNFYTRKHKDTECGATMSSAWRLRSAKCQPFLLTSAGTSLLQNERVQPCCAVSKVLTLLESFKMWCSHMIAYIFQVSYSWFCVYIVLCIFLPSAWVSCFCSLFCFITTSFAGAEAMTFPRYDISYL